MKLKNGFSLIEVILTIGILAVIGVVSAGLLTRTYRSTSDADLIGKLKHNGERASNALSEAIRMADAVVCYDPLGERLILRTSEGKYVRFRFVPPDSPMGSPITKNGYIAKEENITPLTFNTFCQQSPDLVREISLTDRDIKSGVSISNGKFSSVSGIDDKDAVTINFDVNPAGSQTAAQGVVSINTTVGVR